MRSYNSLKRVERKPLLAEACVEAMAKYISAGHVTQLCRSDPDPDLVNYAPVFPVTPPAKDNPFNFRANTLVQHGVRVAQRAHVI